MSNAKNIKRWIDRINSSSGVDSVIAETLLKIQPHSKRQSGIKDIEQNQGVECLLNLIQRPNKRILDVTISILANCLTQDTVRKKVLEAEGIPHIVKILQTIKCDSVLTRACRSVANLANDQKCSKIIHAIGTVELIIKLAKQPKVSSEYLASAFRAIKNLANTPGHKKKLIQRGAVSVLVKYLDSNSRDLVSSSLRALVLLSKACSLEFADHMLANDGTAIGKLVKIIEEQADADKSLKSNALYVITNLTLQGCARPIIGNVGGLRCIANEVKTTASDLLELQSVGPQLNLQGPLPEHAFHNVGALCYCCREAINRGKLRLLDVLPIFVRLLWDERWASIHLFVLHNVLFFEYYEEGLKALHECGVFSVLLHRLVDYSKKEKKCIQAENTVHHAWDGRHIDVDESFDKRHSLSYDVPTRFNQRPQMNETPDDADSASQLWAELCLGWSGHDAAPYSPQWSPLGPSPISGDFAFASESTPPDSPSVEKDESPSAAVGPARLQIEDGAENSYLLLDQDESSSSREGFDLMHSPALLPASGPINILWDGVPKRDCTSSKDKEVDDEVDFMLRMEDFCSTPKRAKIGKLMECDERIRSRSLDTGSENATGMEPGGSAKPQGASSPPLEFMLPHIGSSACSPNFLRFVNETCSVPPQLLKRAGRDTRAVSTSTTTSAWKQTRRRSSGATKRLDDLEYDVTECNTTQACEQLEAIVHETKPLPLTKSASNPLPATEETTSAAKDSVISRDLKSPVQMVLHFLCHYCEMSDSYVCSLAQQDHCTESLVAYMQHCMTELDARFYRIVERLTSCPESFSVIVTSCLMPCIAAAASLRTSTSLLDFDCDAKKSCSFCGLDTSHDCTLLIDNMWHNIALSHSSIYGSDLIKRFLTNGSESESITSACTVILLFLWLLEAKELKGTCIPDSLRKHLLSNLQLMLDRDRLQLLCKTLHDTDVTSEVLQSVSYTVFQLATFTHKSVAKRSEEVSVEAGSDGSSETAQEHTCEYGRHCESIAPDRILTFAVQDCQSLPEERTLRSSRTRKKGRSKTTTSKSRKECCIPVHADVLCARSPMFRAMLTGKYRESSEKQVAIQDVRYETASYIIHRMYGCNDRNCPKMKIFEEVLQSSPVDRYGKFSGSIRGVLNLANCPVELDILRVMDLWLLHEERENFYAQHKNVFLEIYIKEEISCFGKSSLYAEDGERHHNIHGSKDDDSANFKTLHNSADALLFWDFTNANHGSSKIAQDYINTFCSPCLFQHNHIQFQKAFCRATSFFGGVQEAFLQFFIKRIHDTLLEEGVGKLE